MTLQSQKLGYDASPFPLSNDRKGKGKNECVPALQF